MALNDRLWHYLPCIQPISSCTVETQYYFNIFFLVLQSYVWLNAGKTWRRLAESSPDLLEDVDDRWLTTVIKIPTVVCESLSVKHGEASICSNKKKSSPLLRMNSVWSLYFLICERRRIFSLSRHLPNIRIRTLPTVCSTLMNCGD